MEIYNSVGNVSNLNWLGGLIGSLVTFFFGSLWYSKKCLGTVWMDALGKKEEDFEEKFPFALMLLSLAYHLLLGTFITAIHRYVKCPFLFAVIMAIFIMDHSGRHIAKCFI